MSLTLDQARQQVLTTDTYALAYLNLCATAYANEAGQASDIVTGIKDTVPTIATYANDDGYWKLEWGPGITSDLANVIYAASYVMAGSGTPDQPIFTAICMRGTDVSVKGEGLYSELREDLGAHCQVPWPSGGDCVSPTPSDSPVVSNGSWKLLENMIDNALDPNGNNLQSFLAQYLPPFTALPVVVCGHSLGGAATMVVALWLEAWLKNQLIEKTAVIVPNTFAAPTPGNQSFVDLYESTFAWKPRWYNTLDLVPLAWENVEAMKTLWVSACNGISPNPIEIGAIDAAIADVGSLTYAQQSTAWTRSFTNICQPASIDPPQTPSFLSETLYQHSLLTGYYPGVSTYQGVGSAALVNVPQMPAT